MLGQKRESRNIMTRLRSTTCAYKELLLILLCFSILCAVHCTSPALRADTRQDLQAMLKSDKRSSNSKAFVLFFIATDCPISNTYAPEIKRIIAHYAPQKIAFSLVYPDPDILLATAQKHAKAYGYTSPVRLDPAHRLAHLTGATVTPEVAVLTPEGKLLYRGRIDNLYIGLGQRRYAATKHDLRLALDAVVKDKPVPQRLTTAIGCFIPDTK